MSTLVSVTTCEVVEMATGVLVVGSALKLSSDVGSALELSSDVGCFVVSAEVLVAAAGGSDGTGKVHDISGGVAVPGVQMPGVA